MDEEWGPETDLKPLPARLLGDVAKVPKPARLDWVRKAARALYGDAWRSPLARALGVSQSLCQLWADGKASPKPQHVAALYGVLQAKARLFEVAMAACPRGEPRRKVEPFKPDTVVIEAPAPESSLPPMPGEPRRRGRPPAQREPQPRQKVVDLRRIQKALEAKGITVATAPAAVRVPRGSPLRDMLIREEAAKHAAGRLVYADELEQHWRVLPENEGLTEDD